MTTQPPSIDRLAAAYVMLRKSEADLKASIEEQIAALAEKRTRVQTALHQALVAAGATSVKTPHGTVYMAEQQTASIVDVEALWAYAVANNAPELFQRRVTTSEVFARNIANPANPVAGVHCETFNQVRVRAA
jgi:hypothetical protein